MIDNMMTRVKVNNEIDLCEILASKSKKIEEIHHKIAAALQYARISYFVRWQEPGLIGKLFFREKSRPVFRINSAQLEDAYRVLEELQLSNQDIRIIGEKSSKGKRSERG